jgi:hypothetical protein
MAFGSWMQILTKLNLASSLDRKISQHPNTKASAKGQNLITAFASALHDAAIKSLNIILALRGIKI